MNEAPANTIADFTAPFGQQVQLQDVILNDDVRMLRVRIRERSRFTVFDIDPATAQAWGQAMAGWAEATGEFEPMDTLDINDGNDA
jgi:hypothetical protein